MGDAVVKEGRFPGISYPRVPGHEVVGKIDKMGSKVSGWKTGQRVGVDWYGAGPASNAMPVNESIFRTAKFS